MPHIGLRRLHLEVPMGDDMAVAEWNFHGHGAATGDPAQPDPRPANRKLSYCGVIEPNAYGAHEIRSLWWRTLREQDRVQRQ
jgi:hypothetical protein